MSKSQSAMEFIVLASFMLLVLFVFFGLTSSRVLEAKEEGDRKTAEDIANLVYREIEIAKSVNNGYSRTFFLPQTVSGVDYNINMIDNKELVVNYLGYEYVKFLPPNVTGNLGKGIIKISKNNEIILLNTTKLLLPSTLVSLVMKNNIFNVIYFDDKGNVVLKGTIHQNSNQQPTQDDEFIIKDKNKNVIAIINLVNGNMFIKGSLKKNQPSLAPSASSSDFIVKDSNGKVISYIDESGNFFLTGNLIENGSP